MVWDNTSIRWKRFLREILTSLKGFFMVGIKKWIWGQFLLNSTRVTFFLFRQYLHPIHFDHNILSRLTDKNGFFNPQKSTSDLSWKGGCLHKGEAHRLFFSKIKEMMLVYFLNLNHPFYFALTREYKTANSPLSLLLHFFVSLVLIKQL